MENINQTVHFLILTAESHSWNYAYVKQGANRSIDDDGIYIYSVIFVQLYSTSSRSSTGPHQSREHSIGAQGRP